MFCGFYLLFHYFMCLVCIFLLLKLCQQIQGVLCDCKCFALHFCYNYPHVFAICLPHLFKSSLLMIHSHYFPSPISLLHLSWNLQFQTLSLTWKLDLMVFMLVLSVWQGVTITTL